jgi:hypothetical protein
MLVEGKQIEGDEKRKRDGDDKNTRRLAREQTDELPKPSL